MNSRIISINSRKLYELQGISMISRENSRFPEKIPELQRSYMNSRKKFNELQGSSMNSRENPRTPGKIYELHDNLNEHKKALRTPDKFYEHHGKSKNSKENPRTPGMFCELQEIFNVLLGSSMNATKFSMNSREVL